jgi:VanZ family protein
MTKPAVQNSSWREWIWPALLAATIVFASSNSDVAGPDVRGIDKVEHLLIYGLLATLLVRVQSVAAMKPFGVFTAVILTSAFGITDEIHQSFTPGRSVELLDWTADTVGALLAVSIYQFWGIYRAALEKPLGSSRIRARIAA